MSSIDTETKAMVAQHATEIRELRQGQVIVFEKLDALAADGKQLGAALGQINQSLTELRVNKGPGLLQLLDVASRVVTLVGALVVGIVYLSTNGSSPAQHSLDKRATVLELQSTQAAEDRKALAELQKAQAVQEYRLKRAEEDQKALRAAFGWKATVSQN